MSATNETIDIVFDGPPGPDSGRFVEVERDGKSIKIGEWVQRDDGYYALRIPDPALAEACERMAEALELVGAVPCASLPWGKPCGNGPRCLSCIAREALSAAPAPPGKPEKERP